MRAERIWDEADIRYRVVEERRVRYPPRPIRRTRSPVGASDPEHVLTRLAPDRAVMAERVLREGAKGWRYWSTLRRRAGETFSPLIAETELLDQLVRHAGLHVIDVHRNGRWVAQRFMIDQSVREWLGILDPLVLRAELANEITHQALREALVAGPPPGVPWNSFAFVLRCAERLLTMDEHGIRPGARELAGLVDHTKAWSPARRALLERVLGKPFEELVAPHDRQLMLRGPVRHAEGSLWASTIERDALEIEGARGVLLVENIETLRTLLPLADAGWILLQVPGGPPPAEAHLVERLHELAPELRFFAVFDLDPAGIRIARLLEERTGITLDPLAMTPEIFQDTVARRPLGTWDCEELLRLDGRAGAFEPLRLVLARDGCKVEQETLQRELRALFDAMDRPAPAPVDLTAPVNMAADTPSSAG